MCGRAAGLRSRCRRRPGRPPRLRGRPARRCPDGQSAAPRQTPDEQPCGDGAAALGAGVLVVGHGGLLQRRKEALVRRQRPDPLTAGAGGLLDHLGQHPAVAHQCRILAAEGHHLPAGEGGDVDDGEGLLLFDGIGHRVDQGQPALGVGVVDFHRPAGHGAQDIPGQIGGPGDPVLTGGHHGGHIGFDARPGDGQRGPDDGGGPAHIRLHCQHILIVLDVISARVKGDPLAHQRHHTVAVRVPFVAQHDEPGRVGAALCHRQEAPHTQLLDGVVVQDLTGHTAQLRLGGRPLGQCRRRQVAGRGVHQIPGQCHALGQHLAVLYRGGVVPFGVDGILYPLPLFRLVGLIAVAAQCQPLAQQRDLLVAEAGAHRDEQISGPFLHRQMGGFSGGGDQLVPVGPAVQIDKDDVLEPVLEPEDEALHRSRAALHQPLLDRGGVEGPNLRQPAHRRPVQHRCDLGVHALQRGGVHIFEAHCCVSLLPE